jgi:hypothetical protein
VQLIHHHRRGPRQRPKHATNLRARVAAR